MPPGSQAASLRTGGLRCASLSVVEAAPRPGRSWLGRLWAPHRAHHVAECRTGRRCVAQTVLDEAGLDQGVALLPTRLAAWSPEPLQELQDPLTFNRAVAQPSKVGAPTLPTPLLEELQGGRRGTLAAFIHQRHQAQERAGAPTRSPHSASSRDVAWLTCAWTSAGSQPASVPAAHALEKRRHDVVSPPNMARHSASRA